MPQLLRPGRSSRRALLAALLLASAGSALAQYPGTATVERLPQPNDPGERLAAALRTLAVNPNDLNALIEAGQNALTLGDPNAAVGFFGRAGGLAPRDGRIKAGLGSALVDLEKPQDALRLFGEATSLGVPDADIASDRGLAYDLTGNPQAAQRDYRIALAAHPDDDTVRRRLALSQGIAGDRKGAIATLDPLIRKRDIAGWRAQTFVLAMTGDPEGAHAITRIMLPQQEAALQPFLQRLASLSPADKARAVHFGEMPSAGQTYSSAQLANIGTPPTYAPAPRPPAPAPVQPRPAWRAPARSAPVTGAPVTTVVQSAPSTQLAVRSPAPSAPAATAPVATAPAARPAPAPATGAPATASDLAPVAARPAPATMAAGSDLAAAHAAPSPAPSVASGTGYAAAPLAGIALATETSTPSTVAVVAAPAAAAAAPSVTSAPAPASVAQATTSLPAITTTELPPSQSAALPAGSTGSEAQVGLPRDAAAQPIPRAAQPSARPPAGAIAETRAPEPAPAAPEPKPTVTLAPRPPKAKPVQLADEARAKDDSRAKKADEDTGKKGRHGKDASEADETGTSRKDKAKTKLATADDESSDSSSKKGKSSSHKGDESDDDTAKKGGKKGKDKETREKVEPSRVYVQVAGGANRDDLGKAWEGVRKKAPELMKGHSAATTPIHATNRLMVGPFKDEAEAQAFVNKAAGKGLSAFVVKTDKGQKVDKIDSGG